MENIKAVIVWIIEKGWYALCNSYIYKSGDFKISFAAVFVASMIVSLICIVLNASGYGIGSRGGNPRRKAKEEN